MQFLELIRRASVATALVVLSVGPASAQESDGARLFREGRALMLEERFAEACPKLEESQRLEPHTGTLLNVAACHERLGKVGSAWVEYQKAATAAHTEGQVDREKLARTRIGVIEPRVPWLTLAVDVPSDELTVTLDGATVARAAWGKEMPVDPGAHVAAASAPGKAAFEEKLELHEGERRTAHIGALAAEPSLEPRIVVSPGDTPPPAEKPARRDRYVLELDVLVGGISVNSSRPRAVDAVTIRSADGKTERGCDQECSALATNANSIAIGLGGFLGYAVYDWLYVGVAAYGATSASDDTGWFAALGPSLSVRLADAGALRSLRIGVSGLLGTTSLQGHSYFNAPVGFSVVEPSTRVQYYAGSGGWGFGAGLKVDYDLLRLPRGALIATANPLVLRGDYGTGWLITLGAGYRFE